ncbi:MAG: reductive dehalogenase [Candidatus Thorarchaeota archaeon]|jgi:reductive dehalogenase
MYIDQELCKSDRCERECIAVCTKVHGEATHITFDEGALYPRIISECTNCLSCIRACPFGAISTMASESPARQKKQKVSSQQRSEVRPYQTNDELSKFPERDMIFARVFNDPDFEYYGKHAFYGGEAMVSRNIPGYDRFEYERAEAGWKLYDNRASVIGPLLADTREIPKTESQKERNPRKLTIEVRRAAKVFGASLVGVADLDRKWLYSVNRRGEQYDIPERFTHAIVMAIEMDYEGIATSPAFASATSTAVGYSKMAFAEIELTAFIRRLGYSAIPCGNDIALSVPLAIDAGLGQYGRHGLLITKEFGPRVRIAKVLTDMPLLHDSPDYGFCDAVVRFCEVCEKCAHHCPSKSIPVGRSRGWTGATKSNNPGTEKWYVNPESCYGFWIENGSDCSNCIRSCPYNKLDGLLHRTILWVIRYFPWFNRLIVKFDDLIGYGKQKHSVK